MENRWQKSFLFTYGYPFLFVKCLIFAHSVSSEILLFDWATLDFFAFQLVLHKYLTMLPWNVIANMRRKLGKEYQRAAVMPPNFFCSPVKESSFAWASGCKTAAVSWYHVLLKATGKRHFCLNKRKISCSCVLFYSGLGQNSFVKRASGTEIGKGIRCGNIRNLFFELTQHISI